MNLSQNGIEFICDFEGFFSDAYQDQAGIWTIGYGTIIYPNGMSVKKGDTCTKEQAQEYMAFEVNKKCSSFNQSIQEINLTLNQNQYDALISFFYNVGIGKCQKGTTMGDALYSKDLNKIADAFLVYNKYTWKFGIKRISKGLDRRRKAERQLFLS